jgi:hypothetical protein
MFAPTPAIGNVSSWSSTDSAKVEFKLIATLSCSQGMLIFVFLTLFWRCISLRFREIRFNGSP